ncbi:hypothetical protein IscW_ISCW001514 [Ixodes scapularis]|uniref:Ig-like domain-containing protein n=1 Tax=Ixodes scapularis TaxID=6945 RepID=B7P267_IXOSC|nr:hypothetical protein IscW_ISCW001514 [Ixodes scapularis]|eukprot:XP_002401609.1 hypothetical protein IscW_ISCW001514 [Ixodes scapularis]
MIDEACSFLLSSWMLLTGAGAATTALSLVAQQPASPDWPLGATVRLAYVLEAATDTRVTCTLGERQLSDYVLRVPTKSVVHRAHRMLVVSNASHVDAGLYVCRARTANVTRVVAWRVHLISRTPCSETHVCNETAGAPCRPCSCPARKMFYGRNRLFRCYDAGWAPTLRVKEHDFHDRRPVVIDYELTTFGDTQMNWYLNNKLVHTHTTLVNSHEHTVTFNKRLVVPGPYLVDVQRYGLLEAHLRNTDMRASATLSLLVTKLRRDLPCNQTTKMRCLPLNAVCGNYSSGGAGSCQCETNVTRWSRETGSCRKLCSTPKDCEPLGPGARCDALLRPAVCECEFPYVYESHRCQKPECVTAQQCRLKHGLRSFCQQGMCACLAGHVLSAGRCEPVPCLSDEECSEPHMRCLGGVCVCDLDYDLLENECRKSAAVHQGTLRVRPEDVPLRDRLRAVHLADGLSCVRVSCELTEDCNVSRAVCMNRMCTCLDLRSPVSNTCPDTDRLAISTDIRYTPTLVYATLGTVFSLAVFSVVIVICSKKREKDFPTQKGPEPRAEEDAFVMALQDVVPERVLDVVTEASKTEETREHEGWLRCLARYIEPSGLYGEMFGPCGDIGSTSFSGHDV